MVAVTGPKRNPAAPEVPTIGETLPGYEVTSSQALFAPAKTPPDVIDKISADTNAVLANPAIKIKLAETGYIGRGSSPEELEKLLKADIAKWSELAKSANLKLD